MPRRARRRPSGGDDTFERFLAGRPQTQSRRGAEWTVQSIPAARAVKEYTCPGCDGIIPAGRAHLVVWRADGVLGDRADLAARRHWHEHCWRIG